MDLLARREHSRLELLNKLQIRFRKRLNGDVDEAGIEAIQCQIDRLTDEGLQSDYRLAGSVIRSRSNKGHGPVKIGGELRQKGLNDAVITAAFLEENIDWFEKAREVSQRKFGLGLPGNSAERAKRGRFLQQRGFSWDQIQSI
jgi:regulatory protein